MNNEKALFDALNELLEARAKKISADIDLRRQERRSKAGKDAWDKLSWAAFYADKREQEAEEAAELLLTRISQERAA